MLKAWESVESAIGATTGRRFKVENSWAVGGGCINEARVVEGGGRRFFLKLNGPDSLDMFAAEMDGLQAIHASGTLRAPQPLATGGDSERAWLVLEYLKFAPGDGASARLMGERLAAMHADTAPRYGWHRDNYIGATPQANRESDDWLRFLREQRFGPQFELAARNGAEAAVLDKGQDLLAALPAFFSDYHPAPSLLHGDLWGGNWSTLDCGEPVVFDPALYRGDREADIAMSELFGGFSDEFYTAYRHHWPLDAGYAIRRDLYNLYHILNHFNLFGGGYARQALAAINKLLSGIA